MLKQNENNLFRDRYGILWFLWCEDLACDWLKHNKHSRHIFSVHSFISLTVKYIMTLNRAQTWTAPSGRPGVLTTRPLCFPHLWHNVSLYQVPIPNPRRVIGNSKGGSQKPKFLKKNMIQNWTSQSDGGRDFKPKNPWWGGGVWIFSGTTHLCKILTRKGNGMLTVTQATNMSFNMY